MSENIICKKEGLGLAGLKRHTHEEREKVIGQLVPIIKKLLGDNLLAIASQASFARNDDRDFSDLELVIFTKEKQEGLPHGFSRIVDGLLIEGLFFTKEDYLENTLDIKGHWYISGSDTLKPVINPDFINQITDFVVKDKEEKFKKEIRGKMHGLQEAFGKLFTAIESENRESLFIIFFDAVNVLFQLISFINETPYTTLATFTQEAKSFEIKPEGFDEFLQIAIDGSYQNLEKLKKAAVKLYGNMEKYVLKKYGRIYCDDLTTIGISL